MSLHIFSQNQTETFNLAILNVENNCQKISGTGRILQDIDHWKAIELRAFLFTQA